MISAAASALPPGITVLERGWLSSNNILVAGRDSTALVDSGYWTHAEQTLALVQATLGERPLDKLLNTHLHSDHCGGNALLKTHYPRLQTWIPPGQAPHVLKWDPVALTYGPTGQHCPEFRYDALLEPGTEVALGDLAWQVHAAPGHDPHSVILFEPISRVLLSADALWENGFGIIFQELEGERAFDAAAATFDLIEKLSPRAVVPGHGKPFTQVAESLALARQRLEAFARDPQKHAQHAVKVLLKFKLLEEQRMSEADLLDWAARTPYFTLVRERYFSTTDTSGWIQPMLESLLRSGAARREGKELLN